MTRSMPKSVCGQRGKTGASGGEGAEFSWTCVVGQEMWDSLSVLENAKPET